MKKLLVWLSFMLLVSGISAAQGEVLQVDAGQALGPISPYVYGANLGQSGVIPPGMMPKAQMMGMKYVRWGGGDSDRKDLQKPLVDLFVLQARQIGAEPALTVRLYGGTPEQAADMVHYTNIEQGYDIRYWSIGNEPNIFPATLNIPSYTTEDLNRDWRAIAEAMLAVDPNIILVGPDITQYVVLNSEPGNIQYLEGNLGGSPRDRNGKDWLKEFLQVNGDLLGVVSIHRYPYPGIGGSSTAVATIDGLRKNPKEWDTIVPNLRKVIHEWAGRDIPIAVTEVNSNSSQSSGGEASLDSLYNAIWLSDVLGRMIDQQVDIVAYWTLVGNPGSSFGLLDRYGVRPTYYTYLMYTHFGTELVFSEAPDDQVTIYAARRDDGSLTLMVINLADDAQQRTLRLDNFTPSGPAEVWRFDHDHNAEQLDDLSLADGDIITLPGQSITAYVLPSA